MNDAFELFNDQLIDVDLLSDQVLGLVLRVIGIPQPSIVAELKLKELVAELALVPNVIAQVELFSASGTISSCLGVLCCWLFIRHSPVFTLLLLRHLVALDFLVFSLGLILYHID